MASAVVKFVFAGIKSWLVSAGVGATTSAIIAGVITGGWIVTGKQKVEIVVN